MVASLVLKTGQDYQKSRQALQAANCDFDTAADYALTEIPEDRRKAVTNIDPIPSEKNYENWRKFDGFMPVLERGTRIIWTSQE